MLRMNSLLLSKETIIELIRDLMITVATKNNGVCDDDIDEDKGKDEIDCFS